jgi:NADH dehydrogenase
MDRTRIVIVGGGFAGVSCAQRLLRGLPRGTAEVTLFSAENHFVYNPLLAEAVGASLNPLDVVVPLRELIPGAFCRTERVHHIDLARREVAFECYHGDLRSLLFDQLVIACGNVANLGVVPGMADHAFPLKTVGDAITLRSHVLDQLEWAEVCDDDAQRRWHLSFVVVGGGYSGVEVAGEINDLVRGSLHLFRRIRAEDVRVTLVHSRDQILPEIGSKLRDFALRKMLRAGVDVLLNSRVELATPDGAGLVGGRFLRAGTVVSTVGSRASPIVEGLDVAKQDGRLMTDTDLRLSGQSSVWAIGDCARVINAADGTAAPPTAQFADRQGRLAAANIVASLTGRPTRPFAYRPLGQLCCIGGHRAVAEMLGVQVSGLAAWLLWRAVYLMKLPSWSRRLQVGFDWTWLLLFPRDLSHVKPRVTERVAHAHYQAGDFIIRVGEAAVAFYVVERGDVEVVRPTLGHPDGEVIAVLTAGSFFGEQALVSERPRAASVRARTAVDVLVMGRDVFTQISRTLAPLRDAFARALERRSNDLWAERQDVLDALRTLNLRDLVDPISQPVIASTTSLREIGRLLAMDTTDVVWICADGRTLDGIITLSDLLRAQSAGAKPTTPAAEFMIGSPVALTVGDSCITAALIFQEHGYKTLPVIQDADGRLLVGSISLRHLMAAVFAKLPTT